MAGLLRPGLLVAVRRLLIPRRRLLLIARLWVPRLLLRVPGLLRLLRIRRLLRLLLVRACRWYLACRWPLWRGLLGRNLPVWYPLVTSRFGRHSHSDSSQIVVVYVRAHVI